MAPIVEYGHVARRSTLRSTCDMLKASGVPRSRLAALDPPAMKTNHKSLFFQSGSILGEGSILTWKPSASRLLTWRAAVRLRLR